jgi:hypothetical protein
MKTMYSIKQEKIIENVGKNMPRFHATLDNRQSYYQSWMILGAKFRSWANFPCFFQK